MNNTIQRFTHIAGQAFSFLEKEYSYNKIDVDVENKEYYPDARAVVRYIGQNVGVEVYWDFAPAIIGVVFTKLQNGEFPTRRTFVEGYHDRPNSINIYALAQVLLLDNNSVFLLKDTDIVTLPKIKSREKTIKYKMEDVLENLAKFVIKYAHDIITGNTSIFLEVIRYQTELTRRQYP
jgi:hypothetical protein